MDKLKKFFIILLMMLMVTGIVVSPVLVSSAEEEEPKPVPYNNTYEFNLPERELSAEITYKAPSGITGDVDISMSAETNKETLKKFEKYTRKKVDAGDVGEVIYVTTTYSVPEDEQNVNPTYSIKVKVPKFYHKKELAVIAFSDYRSPQKSITPVKADKDGYITFTGNKNAYAYALIYNGAYKDIILIVILLLTMLIICVLVKILCVRRDNPYYQDKKKQKAIAKKKAEHKKNKHLAQELKREKERLKKH